MATLTTFTQRHGVRERLLFYGGPGAGKSSAAASIMLHTPNVNHHIIDMEVDNYERLFMEDPQYAPLAERLGDSIHIYPVDSSNWEEQIAAAIEAGSAAEQGDWWYFDMMTDTWESVQDWFTQKVFATDLADYFADKRVQLEALRNKAPNAKAAAQAQLERFDGYQDWSIINPQYKKLYRTLMNTKAHVCIVAEQDKLRTESKSSGKGGESKENKEAFGHIGYKPKGQKKLGHIPQTVVHFTTHSKDGFHVEYAKDRGRRHLWEEEFGEEMEGPFGEDFAAWYFGKIAKWKKGLVKL